MRNHRCNSKIKILCITSVSIFIHCACTSLDDDVIPYVELDMNPINIYDPTYSDLSSPLGCVIIPDEGYEGNGIVVFRVSENEFKAYDATCTYEIEEGCAVEEDETNILGVKCPCCGSKFELVNDGVVTSGKAQYSLKSYRISYSEPYIYIYN